VSALSLAASNLRGSDEDAINRNECPLITLSPSLERSLTAKAAKVRLWAGRQLRKSTHCGPQSISQHRQMTSLVRFPSWLGFGAVAVLGGALVVGLLLHPLKSYQSPNVSVANGTYMNAQGGSVILRDGMLSTGTQSTGYDVETDKVGPYIIVERRLIIQPDGAVQVGASRDLMKSYMDAPNRPSKITFWMWRTPDDGSPDQYVFARRSDAGSEIR
jgi:hypothetical protein